MCHADTDTADADANSDAADAEGDLGAGARDVEADGVLRDVVPLDEATGEGAPHLGHPSVQGQGQGWNPISLRLLALYRRCCACGTTSPCNSTIR